jgi:hypothetical protein
LKKRNAFFTLERYLCKTSGTERKANKRKRERTNGGKYKEARILEKAIRAKRERNEKQ